MSDEERGSNIIFVNHRQVLDYRTNEKYAKAVDRVTAYVSGGIDIIAYAIYAGAQLSVQAFVAFVAACRQMEDWGEQAGTLYHEKGLDERVHSLTEGIKQKIEEYRQPETVALNSSAIEVEAETLPTLEADSDAAEEGEEELAANAN